MSIKADTWILTWNNNTLLIGEWNKWYQSGDQDTPSIKAVTAFDGTSGRGSASMVVTLVQPCVVFLETTF